MGLLHMGRQVLAEKATFDEVQLLETEHLSPMLVKSKLLFLESAGPVIDAARATVQALLGLGLAAVRGIFSAYLCRKRFCGFVIQ